MGRNYIAAAHKLALWARSKGVEFLHRTAAKCSGTCCSRTINQILAESAECVVEQFSDISVYDQVCSGSFFDFVINEGSDALKLSVDFV